ARQIEVGQAVEGALAARGALAQRAEERKRLDAALHPEGEDLGERGLDGEAGAVVGELRHRAGPDGAQVKGLIPDLLENPYVAFKNLFGSTDPDRELAAFGAARAAAYRRVEKMDPRQLAVQPAHHFRRVGAEIEPGRAFLQGRSDLFGYCFNLFWA